MKNGDDNMSSVQFLSWLPSLLHGLEVTVLASLAGIITSIIWGSILSSLRALNNPVLSLVIRAYTSIFRNTPLLVVMFFLFYGLPMLDITISEVACGLIAITLNEGAFVAEILRGSIANVKKGEIEAAESMGLNRFQIVRYLVFPLAFRDSIPMILGQSSIIIKDTSLFSMIMILDLTAAGSRFYARYFNATSIYIVGFVYILLFLIYSVIGRKIENKVCVRR